MPFTDNLTSCPDTANPSTDHPPLFPYITTPSLTLYPHSPLNFDYMYLVTLTLMSLHYYHLHFLFLIAPGMRRKQIFDIKNRDKPANKKIMNYGISYEITVDIPI